ncbi:MAG: hypothetical protein GWP58_06525 [Gammaproteobacteria bacterium]|nr:hypothetical protein [Gammaproteobacteria bacterium]
MNRLLSLLFSILLMMPALVTGQDVIVTRNFSGLWDQPEHESQGINLQVIDQDSGDKVGVAYWFTYGDDMESAWFFGVGTAIGNRIEMILYEGSGIGFLEENMPGDDQVLEVGTMEMEFSSCNEGEVKFTTEIENVGSGMFMIERLTELYQTECSGGVSDDTPADVLPTEQRISLVSARAGITGSGHADYEERADRTEFSVEVEDLADGSYRILVGGVDQGELVVVMSIGETEFRSPVETGKILLTFDPRGEVIEVHDGQGAVLTSGDSVFEGGDDNGGGDNGGGDNGGSDLDFGEAMIEVELDNTGVFPLASGDAKLEPRADRTDFSVEIEDVPEGSYDLRVGGNTVGTIQAVMIQDGSIQGELEFRNPVEPGKLPLDFDPRGQQIDVLDGGTVILETLFPSG